MAVSLSKDADDQLLDMGVKAYEFLSSLLKRAFEKNQDKSLLKRYQETLKIITNGGKSEPYSVSLNSNGSLYKKCLDRKIEEFNSRKENKGSKNQIHALAFITENGWSYFTDKEGAEKIKLLEKEILFEMGVKSPELTVDAMLKKNINETGRTVENINSNELNLIKERPWNTKGIKDAIKNYPFSFAAIPKKDGTNSILINKKDLVDPSPEKEGFYETILMAKTNLSGVEGKKINDQMNLNREYLSLMKDSKLKDGEVKYLTSSKNTNGYIAVGNNGYSVHQTSIVNGNFVDITVSSVKKENMTEEEFKFQATKDFKSISEPCLVSDKQKCVVHCISSDALLETERLDGSKVKYPSLTPEEVSFLSTKLDIMEKALSKAAEEFDIDLGNEDSKGFEDFNQKALKILEENKKTELELGTLTNEKLKAYDENISVITTQNLTRIKENKTVVIDPVFLGELINSDEKVDVEKFVEKQSLLKKEIEEFGLNDLTTVEKNSQKSRNSFDLDIEEDRDRDL